MHDVFFNFGTLAHSGGLLDQPQAWFDTVLYVAALDEYYELEAERKELIKDYDELSNAPKVGQGR